MNMFCRRYLALAILVAASFVSSSDVFVEINQGTLRGKTVDFVEGKYTNVSTKVNVFKGIPYAEKPIRWSQPEMKKGWDGVLDATNFSYSCPHLVFPELSITPLILDEDCLLLNVFAPNETIEKVAVMVFIHGGGFTSGSSMMDNFSGVPLAAIGNVVIVTINYRVGVLGFLSTGDEAARGNFGLLDQSLALQWVQDNIEAFGGDRSKVTIFGESAGGASVDFHVVSKYSRNLFAQAIPQSGVASALWAVREEFENNKVNEAFRLGSLVNCTTTDTTELVECLRQVDAVVLEETSAKNLLHMGPTIDDVFLDDYPRTIVERGDFKDCPMMIGFNKDEGTVNVLFDYDLANYYYSKEPPYISKADFDWLVPRSLTVISGYTSDLMEDAVKQQYIDWSNSDQEDHDYFEAIIQIYGDDEFSCPAIFTARAHTMMMSSPVYLYYMTHVPEWSIFEINGTGPGWLRAGHAEDLPFVFGYPFVTELLGTHGPMTEEESELSVQFMYFWTNFAKTGDPSRKDVSSPPGVGKMEWPAFTVPELQYKELSLELPVGRGIKAEECAFWNDFKPKLQSYLVSMDEAELMWREGFTAWQTDLEKWRLSFTKYQQEPYCEVP